MIAFAAMVPRILAIAAALAVAAPAARAQVPYDPSRNQSLGIAAGLASGAGVSYQEILPSAFGYRGTLLGWKTGGSSFLDLGVSGLRVLSDDGRRRIYLIGGLSYWLWSDEEDSWSVGAGAGLELPLAARTAVSLEGLFTYWARTEDLLPLPQISIHYLF